jgi:hypothetical protein
MGGRWLAAVASIVVSVAMFYAQGKKPDVGASATPPAAEAGSVVAGLPNTAPALPGHGGPTDRPPAGAGAPVLAKSI